MIAVLFGTLMTAAQGNELLAQAVIRPNTVAARDVPADCRSDEAEQEGVSRAECELMVTNVKIMIASRPPWFRGFQMAITLLGTLVGFASVLVGLALADYRPWAPAAAVIAFAALLVIDTVAFTASLYTGPLLRAVYLWNLILWFSIHLCLLAGALAGRRIEPANGSPGLQARY